jgi:hypothetical protein
VNADPATGGANNAKLNEETAANTGLNTVESRKGISAKLRRRPDTGPDFLRNHFEFARRMRQMKSTRRHVSKT